MSMGALEEKEIYHKQFPPSFPLSAEGLTVTKTKQSPWKISIQPIVLIHLDKILIESNVQTNIFISTVTVNII